MDNHDSGNKIIDVILWVGGAYFGALAHFAEDITMQDTYYAIATISVIIVACKNIWEWREKIKAKKT